MTVDLTSVRASVARLALLSSDPSIRPPLDHLETLMAPTDSDLPSDLVAVRFPADLLAALDAEVARRREEDPDVACGRSNVVRSLVRAALLPGTTGRVAPVRAGATTRRGEEPQGGAAMAIGSPPSRVRGTATRIAGQPSLRGTGPRVSGGRPRVAVTADELAAARAHVEALQAQGASAPRIAAKAGVSADVVQKLVAGRAVSGASLAAILAVTP